MNTITGSAIQSELIIIDNLLKNAIKVIFFILSKLKNELTSIMVLYLINAFAIEVHQAKTTLSHRITLKYVTNSLITNITYWY